MQESLESSNNQLYEHISEQNLNEVELLQHLVLLNRESLESFLLKNFYFQDRSEPGTDVRFLNKKVFSGIDYFDLENAKKDIKEELDLI